MDRSDGPAMASSGGVGGTTPASPRTLLDRAVDLARGLAGIVLVLVMATVVVGIVARAVFASPIPWILELTGMGLVYMTFLAVSHVAAQDDHVRLELLDAALPPRALAVLKLFAIAFQALVAAVLLYATAALVFSDLERGTHTGGYLQLDRWALGIVLPVGSALLVLQLVRDLVHHIRRAPPDTERGRGPTDA